jgi:iron complex outermembrane receptor protein
MRTVRKYALLNARIGWEDDAQRLRLSFFVNNVTNKSYVSTGYDLSTLCGCTEVAYGKPRWWGISAGFSFQ